MELTTHREDKLLCVRQRIRGSRRRFVDRNKGLEQHKEGALSQGMSVPPEAKQDDESDSLL